MTNQYWVLEYNDGLGWIVDAFFSTYAKANEYALKECYDGRIVKVEDTLGIKGIVEKQ